MDDEISRIAGYLSLFIRPGDVTELRAFGDAAYSGFFEGTQLESMARAARDLERNKGCRGIYFTPNPVNRQLLDRSRNRISPAGSCAKDSDIESRRWLLIDIDPVRPADSNSSKAERDEAWRVLCHVQSTMEIAGFRDPVIASSGNGWHISYRVEMPNDDLSRDLVKTVLNGLDRQCSSRMAKVDVKTYNASRIWKLYGTRARKGAHSEDRPHRVAWVCEHPPGEPDASSNTAAIGKLIEMWRYRESVTSEIDTQSHASEPVRRCAEYLAKVPPAISHQSGHDKTYHVAMIAVEGFSLSEDDALEAMRDWNGRCQPPWSESELRHKLRDASKNAVHRGHLLGSNSKLASTSGTIQSAQSAYSPDNPDATARHIIADQRTMRWVWQGWMQASALVAIASEPGAGKTRLCADLARRLANGLPWPDGQPNPYPAGSTVIWLCADNQFPEIAEFPEAFQFDPDCIYVNGYADNPYAGTNLDTDQDVAELKSRIERVKPVLVFIDTCTSATSRNTTRPEEAKLFFKPLADIATELGVTFVMVTHLNANGEALGRRITGSCRQVIKLDYFDPDDKASVKRKLWIEKSNGRKPDPLVITMGDDGNDYESESSAPKPPGPTKSPEQQRSDDWLLDHMLLIRTGRMSAIIDAAELAGIHKSNLFRSANFLRLVTEQIQSHNGQLYKHWTLPDIDAPDTLDPHV